MLVQTKEPWELAGQNGVGKSLLRQFQGSEGRRRLIDALMAQPLIRDQDLAVAVALRMDLEEVPAGATLIEQGASDTDLYLIIEGAVSISIDGRIAARKNAGEHVGEMAVVDPGTPRSASAIATCDSIVGRIAERDFSMLADRYPRLWRRIALDFANLLRSEYAANHPRQ